MCQTILLKYLHSGHIRIRSPTGNNNGRPFSPKELFITYRKDPWDIECDVNETSTKINEDNYFQ